MAKSKMAIEAMPAPVNRAMVFICQKCGKRAGDDKHASHRLASRLKRAAKGEFGKGEVRILLTSCMDACPEDRIAVSVQPLKGRGAAQFFEADVRDAEAGSQALLELVRQL
jgi:predicted metal-binding protein